MLFKSGNMRRLLLFSLFLVTQLSALCQHTLLGSVVETVTNKPVANASVYIPELQRGTASRNDGSFVIDGLKKGKLLFQISHIGYESFFVSIDLQKDTVVVISLKPSLIEMKEVIVYGSQTQSPEETTFNISQLTQTEIQQAGAMNISDALSRLPGVSQLTTGPGISKPVIRGLYGNRIQINVNGLRFDNQQWQDEHGLGLSDMGVDRLEVIKGPISVLYGSDAMGGVVNVMDEKPALINTQSKDFNIRAYSNTYGVSLNYGIKKSTQNRWKVLRFGFDNHADYSDGNNERVLNSRFASYNVKAAWGRTKENSVHALRVNGSFSQFGFVFDSLTRKEEDGRMSRSFTGPHHLVGFAQVTSENTYYREHSKLKLNGGFISNLRMEDEGGGGISLSMLLNTLNGLAQVSKPVAKNGEWVYGTSLMLQTNTNFGGRIIVPDAITSEGSLFSFYKNRFQRWLFEAGARYDLKFIETFATSTLNVPTDDSPTNEIIPFRNFYNAFNLSAGIGFTITKQLSFHSNVSTAYRPGNLAELSSNGLHEGTLRWEIGLPNATIEQNLNVEGSFKFHSSQFQAEVSAYRNQFRNFFYLSPTGNEYYGFAIYQYLQTDAILRGGELSIAWNPKGAPLDFTSTYSIIEAEKSDGSYLPFIPANKTTNEIRFHFKSSGSIHNPIFKIGSTYVFDQNRPAQFETATKSYWLIQAGIAGEWKKTGLSLQANNLLNKNYFDHLSRFKYYGIANMGRTIILSLNFKL
jgi:iron complex outermembrane receptor protein